VPIPSSHRILFSKLSSGCFFYTVKPSKLASNRYFLQLESSTKNERFMATHHNVDPEEIAKFSAVASRWWDPEGEFKPLHRINPLRLEFIADHSHGLFGKKCLDI